MPGHDTSSLFHVTAAWPRSSMEEFLRRRAVSNDAGRFAAAFQSGRAAAGHHPNRGTAAKKTTPVRRLTVNRKPLRTHGSLAQAPIPRNGLYSRLGISLGTIDHRIVAAAHPKT